MTSRSPDVMIWYASYGSNLLRERFLTYLTGGAIPRATDGRPQRGARDASHPTADRPFELNHRLLFAHSATRWGGGGVAKIALDRNDSVITQSRAWRISLRQLEDVFAQENRRARTDSIDLDRCVTDGRLDVWPSRYGTLLHVGAIGGEPVLTFTGVTSNDMLRPAHLSYLSVVAAGLAELRGWNMERAAHYLASCPGNQGAHDPMRLADALSLPTQ